jgi:transposase-like protein
MESNNQRERRTPILYPESYKLQVCKEYLETGASKTYLRQKYKIAGRASIDYWLRKFGFETKSPTTQGLIQAEQTLAMQNKELESVEDLKKRIKALERELEDARLKERAANLTIEIAEKQLNIQIRKKFNTK